jgi:DNA polymerase epsilon subunit 1
MEWQWKGEFFPLTRGEYEKRVKLQFETLSGKENVAEYHMPELKKLVKQFCQKHYKQQHQTKVLLKQNTVCMRENPFYVNTVRDFRDRRYIYKGKAKVWFNKLEAAIKSGDAEAERKANGLNALYESLQLAHKVILNSFYGYVMRRGARWYSMEMAAMVTHTGSEIIQDARKLLVRIGKPLELDTDGVWTLLPQGFPENFTLNTKDGKKLTINYPCTMMNMLVYNKYLNPQYQTLNPEKRLSYDTTDEMTIFFEIDGPYKAMMIPAAREEGKVLKKRYAVFDMRNKMTEVKGFEIKRRGELKILKIFQSEIFACFVKGRNLKECYEICGKTCDKWLNVLFEKAAGMEEDEVIEFIGESKVLSREIADYDAKKTVALTAGKRMCEFLGNDVMKGKGIRVGYVISKKPANDPVASRAVPIAIFGIQDEQIRLKFLRKWLKQPDLKNFKIQEILDWDYYIERLGNTMQKIVTIPAALQMVENPVPRLAYPDWLNKKVKEQNNKHKQTNIQNYFAKNPKKVSDLEDIMGANNFNYVGANDGANGLLDAKNSLAKGSNAKQANSGTDGNKNIGHDKENMMLEENLGEEFKN